MLLPWITPAQLRKPLKQRHCVHQGQISAFLPKKTRLTLDTANGNIIQTGSKTLQHIEDLDLGFKKSAWMCGLDCRRGHRTEMSTTTEGHLKIRQTFADLKYHEEGQGNDASTQRPFCCERPLMYDPGPSAHGPPPGGRRDGFSRCSSLAPSKAHSPLCLSPPSPGDPTTTAQWGAGGLTLLPLPRGKLKVPPPWEEGGREACQLQAPHHLSSTAVLLAISKKVS